MYYRNINAAYDLGVVHDIRIIVWTCGREVKEQVFHSTMPLLLYPQTPPCLPTILLEHKHSNTTSPLPTIR